MKLDPNELPHFVSGACLEVHRELGPGLSSAVYRDCLARELRMRELFFEADIPLLVQYHGMSIRSDHDLIDFIVEDSILLLVRSQPGAIESDRNTLKSFLRHTGLPHGMLVNFDVRDLRTGIWRVARCPRHSDDVRDLVLPS